MIDHETDMLCQLYNHCLNLSARSSHITQIAAVCGSDRFSQYILPKIPITDKATEVTGLRVIDGKMFHDDKEVDAVYLVAAVDALLNFEIPVKSYFSWT